MRRAERRGPLQQQGVWAPGGIQPSAKVCVSGVGRWRDQYEAGVELSGIDGEPLEHWKQRLL